jgi:outer membrane protein assembly factor BamB
MSIRFIPLYILILLQVQSFAQDQQLDLEAENIYPFGTSYINLNNFQKFDLEELPALTFKTESIYAARFRGLSIDRLAHKGKLFEIRPNNGLLMTNMSTKAAIPLTNHEAGYERFGQNFLIEAADGMVYIKYLNGDYGFRIYKYNTEGEEALAVQVDHSEEIKRPNLTYKRPYLNYFCHTKWQLILTSYMADKAKTVVVELSNGKVLEYDFTSRGIIRDAEDDAFVHGFIQLDAQSGKMQLMYRQQNFELTNEDFKGCNRVETVLKDNILILACYNDRASGAKLFAVDLEKESIVWNISAMAPKSGASPTTSYYNMLWLSLKEDKILLEGLEPELKYFKVFNFKSGQQLAEFELER